MTHSSINRRRRVLLQSLALSLACPSLVFATGHAIGPLVVSGYLSDDPAQPITSLVWLDPETKERQELQLGFRGHGLSPHPAKPGHVVLFARRPGIQLVEVDLLRRQITREVTAQPAHHFYGHGVFSRDGSRLYTTENRFVGGEGVISVRSGLDYQLTEQFPSQGIGPHDIRLLSDDRTLVVANGGIRTHLEQPRKKLNIESMKPSLTYLSDTGQLLEQHRLADHKLSIRHLAVAQDDQVVAIQQYQGDRKQSVPLVAFHRRGDALRLPAINSADLKQMNQYTASAAADSGSDTALVTCPRGNVAMLWDMRKDRLIHPYFVQKPYGVAFSPTAQAYTITAANGEVHRLALADLKLQSIHRHAGAWDNHMVWLG